MSERILRSTNKVYDHRKDCLLDSSFVAHVVYDNIIPDISTKISSLSFEELAEMLTDDGIMIKPRKLAKTIVSFEINDFDRECKLRIKDYLSLSITRLLVITCLLGLSGLLLDIAIRRVLLNQGLSSYNPRRFYLQLCEDKQSCDILFLEFCVLMSITIIVLTDYVYNKGIIILMAGYLPNVLATILRTMILWLIKVSFS